MSPRKRVFLDANVLVAIGFRPDGDYRMLLDRKDCAYITSDHILDEVSRNLTRLGVDPGLFLTSLRMQMELTNQVTKLPAGLPLYDDDDRQALAEAIAAECAEFVTFNSRDFNDLYGQTVYGVLIRHSGEFLSEYLSQEKGG